MKIPFKFPALKMPTKLTNFVLKTMMKTKKKSPEICLVTGLIAGGSALVLVGVKTWKNKDKLVNDIQEVKKYKNYDREAVKEEHPDWPLMTDEDISANFRRSCKTAGIDIVKTYWIPTVLAISSATLIIGGHHILRKELSAVTTAYAVLFDSYKKYREGIIDRYGIEVDQELMHGVKISESIDPNTGEVIKTVARDPNANLSMYARWFDEGDFDNTTSKWIWRNNSWRDNKLENIRNLKFLQSSANDIFKSKGWMKLNEVYTMLGMPCTKEGEVVGWVLGSGHDDFIDFGVFPTPGNKSRQLPVNALFLDPRHPQNSALCDFNVDGRIDYIFDNILEYDTRSYISGNQRHLN